MFMKWLSNVRMAYKILCLAFVAAIGLAAVSFTGFSSLQHAEKTVNTLSEAYLPSQQYLADNQLNMRKIQSAMLEAIATPDPERRVKMKNDLNDKYTSDFMTAWNGYKKLMGNNPAVQPKLADVEQKWQDYQKVSGAVIDLTIDNRIAEASVLYGGDGIRKLNALKESLTELQEICSNETQTAQQTNAETAESTNRMMVILSVAAFLLLFLAANYIIREITSALREMISVCQSMKDGDFRDSGRDAALNRGDELGEMWSALLGVRTNLRGLMRKFGQTAEHLATASEELTASSQQSAESSNQVAQSVTDAAGAAAQQKQSVDRSNQAVAEVADSVRTIEDTSSHVADSSQQASRRARHGAESVDDAVRQMQDVEQTVRSSAAIVDKLGERSQEIGQIVDTISEIADQTNLLALNAAIEAARAGEYGRGFAVVADEVRKLAEQSQDAAQRIAALISRIQQDTSAAVDSMQTGRDKVVQGTGAVSALKENFGEIVTLIENIADEIRGISNSMRTVSGDTERITASVEELSKNSQSISGEMQSVSAATEEQTASAQDIAQASDSLAGLAQELQAAIRVFQL